MPFGANMSEVRSCSSVSDSFGGAQSLKDNFNIIKDDISWLNSPDGLVVVLILIASSRNEVPSMVGLAFSWLESRRPSD